MYDSPVRLTELTMIEITAREARCLRAAFRVARLKPSRSNRSSPAALASRFTYSVKVTIRSNRHSQNHCHRC
jgi:hypothetical protein